MAQEAAFGVDSQGFLWLSGGFHSVCSKESASWIRLGLVKDVVVVVVVVVLISHFFSSSSSSSFLLLFEFFSLEYMLVRLLVWICSHMNT